LEAELNGDQGWQRTLLDFWRQSNTDIEVFLSKIAGWFNDTGDWAHGWFKRRLGWLLFGTGFVVAVVLNADTLHIFRTLTESSELRKAYVDRALQLAEEGSESAEKICRAHDLGNQLGEGDCTALAVVKAELPELLPLVGWDGSTPISKELGKVKNNLLKSLKKGDDNQRIGTSSDTREEKENVNEAVVSLSLFGWILTAFALSLGAPFWFDLLQNWCRWAALSNRSQALAQRRHRPANEREGETVAKKGRAQARHILAVNQAVRAA
ncbi:MAG: hypothetical protein ACREBC_34655, partial [Pyrinomonadaceae bacterium]